MLEIVNIFLYRTCISYINRVPPFDIIIIIIIIIIITIIIGMVELFLNFFSNEPECEVLKERRIGRGEKRKRTNCRNHFVL